MIRRYGVMTRHRDFKCAAVLVIALGSIAISGARAATLSVECLTGFEPIVSEAGLDAISNALGKFATASGSITFKSSTLLEDIASTNRSVASAFDLATGRMVFLIDMDKFEFKKSLMGEHFRDLVARLSAAPAARHGRPWPLRRLYGA